MAIKQANAVSGTDTASATSTEVKQEAVESKNVASDTTAAETAQAHVAEVETSTKQPEAEVEQKVDRQQASSAVLDEEEPEPAPAKEEPKATGTAIQQQTGSTSVAKPVHQQGFLAEIMQSLNEEGFEGTELDYSSFLNVTLNKQIETSEGHELPNSGFLVRLASARKKYCFRNNNPVEDEVEVAYSYDINAPQDPESQVAKSIAKWREEGLDLAPGKDGVKEYLEVLAQILDDKIEGEQAGELTGKLITIQIAPTSQGRWAGYLMQLKLAKKQISEVVTLVRRGKKVESGKFPFYPWDFVNKGTIED